jgi:hypothetical protein
MDLRRFELSLPVSIVFWSPRANWKIGVYLIVSLVVENSSAERATGFIDRYGLWHFKTTTINILLPRAIKQFRNIHVPVRLDGHADRI